ncbi:MAG: hypothetical protein ACK4GT_05605 [Pararhodobacter sp.]
MFIKTTQAALLGSVAALAFSAAHAQTAAPADQTQGAANPEACVVLADRLNTDEALDAQLRTEVETVIATGNVVQCEAIFTAWEQEGAITNESLELVATEQVTERMIVQQEVEVAADVAVYQPPAQVDVDAGTAEVMWSMPRQSVTVTEHAPEITIRQGQPVVNVEIPQPRITVMIPEPEIVITWPESTIDMAQAEPQIEVRVPEPIINVTMPDPIVELTIGGGGPSELMQLSDGRYAPQGATEEDLQPRITVNQSQPVISAGAAQEEAEVVFNRGEPVVTYEAQEPQVSVQQVGEAEVRVMSAQEAGQMAPAAEEGAAPVE